MVADVPVGAFLSGRIDSSLVVSLMQAQSRMPVRTLPSGWTTRRTTRPRRQYRVARHLGQHTELYVSVKDALDTNPEAPSRV